jgi:hypothetical protein
MKKSGFILFILFISLAVNMNLEAQSNDIIDALLAEEQASYGKAAYLALTASGLITEEQSPEQALEVLKEQGWKLDILGAGEPIKLGEYSFILMKAFHIQGGVMYSILPGPRYAGRELSYLGMILGSPSPYRTISGEEAIRILGNILEWQEEGS